MPPTRDSIDDKLARLVDLDSGADPEEVQALIRTALHDRHYRVAAKAASLCAEKLLYDLEADLLSNYSRFLENPQKRDPNCIAKRAFARALVDLGCNDVTFFLDGVRYQQLEPVWGGSVDTAVDHRCSCAMGLVATGYPRALHELTWLLAEDEANARRGAVRAIACANPKDAELLLRFKVLTGDEEPEVIADCMSALLNLEPEESVPFVTRYLGNDDDTLQELAALALGESRLPDAIEPLLAAWKGAVIPTHFQKVLIRAIALHRSDKAFDWLLCMIKEAHSGLIPEVVEALPLYTRTARHIQRIRIAFEERNDQKMLARFSHLWEP